MDFLRQHSYYVGEAGLESDLLLSNHRAPGEDGDERGQCLNQLFH